jgi:hypothetical protein
MTDTRPTIEPLDRAAQRLANVAAIHTDPDGLDGDGQRYPLHDDIRRAVYPDAKVAHIKGESPIVQEKRELADKDRGPASDGANPVTKLPDGEHATNDEAVAHNDAKDAEAKATIDVKTGADKQATVDRYRDRQQAREASNTTAAKPAKTTKK